MGLPQQNRDTFFCHQTVRTPHLQSIFRFFHPLIVKAMAYDGSSSSNNRDGISKEEEKDENPEKFDNVLDPGSYRRLNDVRKQIWYQGAKGLVIGTGIGAGCYLTYQYEEKQFKNKTIMGEKLPPLPRNAFIPTVMISGALFSFVFSAVSGRVGFQNVSDIFTDNAKPKSGYQKQLYSNEKQLRSDSEESFIRREIAIREALERKQQQQQGRPSGPSF